jgi:phosphoglycolate phosphatase
MIRAAAVIIDLDGTLLDTAADLAAATNRMLRELGLHEVPVATVARYIGKGVDVLVHRALSGSLHGRAHETLHARGRESFMRHYADENGRQARPYPGVRAGLDAMQAKRLRLACVTNKPQQFTLTLLERTGLLADFEVVLGGDVLPRRKPDPLPMLEVARRFGLQPSQVVAIGDSVNDALAARAAGMPALLVPYGYSEGQDVRSLEADGIVDSLLEAAGLIEPSTDRGPTHGCSTPRSA